MMIALLLLATVQAGSAEALLQVKCSLVTPRSEAIEFSLGSSAQDGIRLEPAGVSAWPTMPIAGVRRGRGSDLRYTLSGADRLVFELAASADERQQRSATLFRRERGGELPVAYGYCEPGMAAQSDGDAIVKGAGDDSTVLDVERWSNGACGLVLSDGRRARLAVGGAPGKIEFATPILWQGQSVTVDERRLRNRAPFVNEFHRRGGPAGVRMTFVALPGAAVDLIRFRGLGDSRASNISGYAICGFTPLVRRAN
jgi:hypothetical protein